MVKRFVLPKRKSLAVQQPVSSLCRGALDSLRDLPQLYVGRQQQVNMIGHLHDISLQVVLTQRAVTKQQRLHNKARDSRLLQPNWTRERLV